MKLTIEVVLNIEIKDAFGAEILRANIPGILEEGGGKFGYKFQDVSVTVHKDSTETEYERLSEILKKNPMSF